MKAFTVALALGVIISACGNSPVGVEIQEFAAGPDAMPMQNVVRSPQSSVQTPLQLLIPDQAGWEAAWAKITVGRADAAAPPAIDFTTTTLVVAATGPRPTTGYDVEIRSVALRDGVIVIDVVQRMPGKKCGTGDMVTSPIHIVAVSRLTGAPAFRTHQQVRDC